MFKQARIKLTLWYLLIIFCINLLFSAAFYQVASREIRRFINRISHSQQEWRRLNPFIFPQPPEDAPSLVELRTAQKRLLFNLILINLVILIISGGLAYLLADKTLNPIKKMIDDQSQFISHSSHELRTPLASLRAEMEANLLEKNISDKEARKLIKSNLEEVGRLQQLSDNLLSLVTLDQYQPTQYSQSVAIQPLISQVVKLLSPLARKNHLTITTEISDATVKGDSDQLREVFTILLDNAIKYSPAKSTITISTQINKNEINIHFKDQGIGISPTEIDKIFHRFYRSDQSRSQTKGYGLGLAIAQQIAQQHQGRIHATSQLGHGSIFTVSLPLDNS